MLKNLYKDLNFINDEHTKINIILVFSNIRKATYTFLSSKILKKIKKFISKHTCLEILIINNLLNDITKGLNAVIIYNTKYTKDIEKFKFIKGKNMYHTILGELLGFSCPRDFTKSTSNVRHRYNITAMNTKYHNIDIIYYTCEKEDRKAISQLKKLSKKIEPIVKELGFRNMSVNYHITTNLLE